MIEVTAANMQELLARTLAPTQLEVIDESGLHAGHAGANGTGFGTHFRVRIASPMFEGRPRVARHRLVYDSLQTFIDNGAHAIAIEIL
ncbi:BolA family protein [Diaphorobacter aerolatus]|uniref:BolA family transcriptional regulator n=1 Tax=Diaphorobacter aerolatus TaxID=1288495 RepID=A0A7H0GK60_9BURK|nr:BolA family protein [Diaphorobacter aerolatus]QNP48676.1 BolA family transcriptional regulator [Diaphorobacter aerolatus]